jgi:hypothetical protein
MRWGRGESGECVGGWEGWEGWEGWKGPLGGGESGSDHPRRATRTGYTSRTGVAADSCRKARAAGCTVLWTATLATILEHAFLGGGLDLGSCKRALDLGLHLRLHLRHCLLPLLRTLARCPTQAARLPSNGRPRTFAGRRELLREGQAPGWGRFPMGDRGGPRVLLSGRPRVRLTAW